MNNSIQYIINKKICSGCGSCIVACPVNAITMIYGERYNYPHIDFSLCIDCGKCFNICPSVFLIRNDKYRLAPEIVSNDSMAHLIHSTDMNIRKSGASGGFISGIFVYLLEKKLIDGCVVSRCQGKNPLIVSSFIARDKETIISSAGSKYSPTSACTVLKDIINTPGKYAFVGTPCMLEGLANLEKYFPELKERIVLKIGFVCAGMASRFSTKDYIEKHGNVSMNDVWRIEYRGNGWPGRFRAFDKKLKVLFDRPLLGGSLTHVVGEDTYLRCQNCLDHWSYYADIVVSDPWKDEMVKGEKLGWSAVLLKSRKGKDIVFQAISDGYFHADNISVDEFKLFNKHLIIHNKHIVYSWIMVYRFIFLHKIQYFFKIIYKFLKHKRIGLLTTIKARIQRKYYR